MVIWIPIGIQIQIKVPCERGVSAMGFDPDFFANVNAVEVPELNVSINEDIQEILQEQLNLSNYPVSKCDELYLSVRMFLLGSP